MTEIKGKNIILIEIVAYTMTCTRRSGPQELDLLMVDGQVNVRDQRANVGIKTRRPSLVNSP